MPDEWRPSEAAVDAAAAMRDLTASLVTGSIPEEVLAAAAADLADLARRLSPWARSTRYGPDVPFGDMEGLSTAALLFTNSVTGIGNPVAPPFSIDTRHGVSEGSGSFGPAYEGAPGQVHGGFIAAVFESLMPRPAAALGRRVVTGTLTVRYRAPVPISTKVDLRAEVDSVSGRKVHTTGTMSIDGTVHAEATAVTIQIRRDADRREP